MYLPNRCALGTNIRHPGVLFAASSIFYCVAFRPRLIIESFPCNTQLTK